MFRTLYTSIRRFGIAVPSNVITPSLLKELRKQGVKIEEIPGKGGIESGKETGVREQDTESWRIIAKGVQRLLREQGSPVPSDEEMERRVQEIMDKRYGTQTSLNTKET
ncbi:MAG: hypothetical protein J5569_00010 [Oscillospiraceae bacterium]|nr:hypothetical protein [Oscillospiraceae bacterium]